LEELIEYKNDSYDESDDYHDGVDSDNDNGDDKVDL
jgi:hypothetical protein